MRIEVTFEDNDGTKPKRMLAEAELHFTDGFGPLDGLKLVGFNVWEGNGGGYYVTLPARAYGVGADRRYFDFVRSIDGDHSKTGALKDYVRDAWKRRHQDRREA